MGGKHADYDELRRLSELSQEAIDADPLQAFVRAVDPDDQLGGLKEYCFDDADADVTDAYSRIRCRRRGLFNEVAHKL